MGKKGPLPSHVRPKAMKCLDVFWEGQDLSCWTPGSNRRRVALVYGIAGVAFVKLIKTG
jgi:hypothetical protein